MRDLFGGSFWADGGFPLIQVARAQWKLSSPKIWEETSCFGLRWVLVGCTYFAKQKRGFIIRLILFWPENGIFY